MNKYKVYFCGDKTYFATDSNKATELAEQDAKTIPSIFNVEVFAVEGEEE
jgi:hypothetical protein